MKNMVKVNVNMIIIIMAMKVIHMVIKKLMMIPTTPIYLRELMLELKKIKI